MSAWFNYTATLKILIFSLLAGARWRRHRRRRPLLVAVSWAIFALVLAVVIIGVLYIARDFIAHHTGWAFLGATPK